MDVKNMNMANFEYKYKKILIYIIFEYEYKKYRHLKI